jgi:hypothetical protein
MEGKGGEVGVWGLMKKNKVSVAIDFLEKTLFLSKKHKHDYSFFCAGGIG